MTAAEFRTALAQLGWSAPQLAALLGCDRTLVHAWLTGRATVPRPLGPWLRGCVSCLRRHPVPQWRVRRRPDAARSISPGETVLCEEVADGGENLANM